jgi:hypothetical protein
MAQRIEEVFKSVAPKGRGGQSVTSGIDAAVTGSNLSPALAEAASEIAKLREVYQRQADLIAANTQALSHAGSAGSSVAGKVANTASSALGSGLGLLSPIVSGLLGLFGHHATTPAPLPVYTPPAPVAVDAVLRSASAPAPATAAPAVSAAPTPAVQPAYAPQITVNVSAMDSRSFLDRSTEIASAVREAMLNNHPINGVISDL